LEITSPIEKAVKCGYSNQVRRGVLNQVEAE
jgi:hypothetical protein